MKYVPPYPKVLTLGSSRTERALEGKVIIQEKVDGSQFRFGLNEDNEIVIASHRKQIPSYEQCQKMFRPGYKYIQSIAEKIKDWFPPDTYFYGEYLKQPKHNTLHYERKPKNHIVLFDVLENGMWLNREELKDTVKILEVDLIPELWRGELDMTQQNKSNKKVGYTDIDRLKALKKGTLSYLGKEMIEGIVIKNYNQSINLGGHIFPLFTKSVTEKFKERHSKNPAFKKDQIAEFLKSFKNKNRWEKAVQHLKEDGKLSNTPKDIGTIYKEVHTDIIEEEAENIKEFFYNFYIKRIKKESTKGLAEWYKDKLMDNLE